MAMQLIVMKDGRTLDTFKFPENQKRVLIGRGETCQVRIDDPGISRRHAEIVPTDNVHQLRDLGSANGTYVGGKEIKVHTLNDDEVITLAGYTLRYTADALLKPVVEAVEQRPLGDMTLKVSATRKIRRTQGLRASKVRGYLALTKKDGSFDRNILFQQAVYVFGADDAADCPVVGRLAPRVAVVLVREATGFLLIDVSPKGNYLEVDGRRLPEVRLEGGEQVRIGDVQGRFYKGLPELPTSGRPTQKWRAP